VRPGSNAKAGASAVTLPRSSKKIAVLRATVTCISDAIAVVSRLRVGVKPHATTIETVSATAASRNQVV
jgi:hypothetical protein